MPADAKASLTPRPFLMPPTAVAAPGEEIPWPAYSREVDHEVELAAVIGRPARCVSPADAPRHVAGYTIANDISARSVTYAAGRRERPKDAFFDWLHGKWSDRFCPLGPHLVTPDEVGDPHDLRITLEVDGDVRQLSSTRHMIHDVFEVVSFLSHLMTLTPGDVIATGTPSGVGKATGKLLAGGETLTCRVENIGELTNTLGRPPGDFYAPCRR
jgi:2-keto-4-pentenoate hydratase/2-oxohepta-3-ene-1,7-dioic acid hydratase in catechol pathway